MWTLYDTLVAGIPPEIRVRRAWAGPLWSAVESDAGMGVARNLHGATRPATGPAAEPGRSLQEAAERIKSWNYQEASMGLAALNAWYNTPQAWRDGGALCPEEEGEALLRDLAAGKQVAWVGHIPALERQLCPLCQSCVLERSPLMGDYPDTACDYLLPGQEVVFATAAALVNKTLPRLLQLARGGQVVLWGPGVPLAPGLFSLGITHLAGFWVDNREACTAAIWDGKCCQLSPYGRILHLPRGQIAACIA